MHSCDFFVLVLVLTTRSKHFLRVQIMANSAEDFDGWFGWVESRLWQLFLRYVSCLFDFDNSKSGLFIYA